MYHIFIDKMPRYHQGLFTPNNKSKYVGDVSNIVYRSSWEKKFMIWADNNPSILHWASEEFPIIYYSPVDQKMHRYFVDFIIHYKTNDGEEKRALIEIKPKSQTKVPRKSKNQERYLEEVVTYTINDAKWKAARDWASARGMEFIIITEKELGIK